MQDEVETLIGRVMREIDLAAKSRDPAEAREHLAQSAQHIERMRELSRTGRSLISPG